MPLTVAAVNAAKPSGKIKKLYDSAGLYLIVNPSGSKLWRFKYRFQQKEKGFSFGGYPAISLKDARDRRDQARKLLANGVDPGEHRQAKKAAQKEQAANSFEVIAREWFRKQSRNWVASHADRIIRRLERDVFPYLGKTPIATITPVQLLGVIQKIEKREKFETAHRAMSNCSQVLRFGVATGRCERDITQDLRGALQPVKSHNFAAITDPKEVGGLLRAIEGFNGTVVVKSAMQLAPLTFVRPYELRHGQWADIHFEQAEWSFIASKTDQPHIVPLSRQSMAILNDLYPITGTSKYIFPSARSRTRPMSDNAVLVGLRAIGVPKEKMTGHGWRACARTLLDEVLGFRPDFIEHQLAHAVRDPNGRAYNRTAHLPERRKMMQRWADYLDQLKASGEVVPLLHSVD